MRRFFRLVPLILILSIDSRAENTIDPQALLVTPIEIPQVLTAVRLHQPASEVPASVTTLDRAFIEATGAKNLPELLRYVPGILVVPNPSDNSDTVTYHGGPSMHPRYMQFLIDGRALYRSSLSVAGAYQAPVAVEDIERIEVVRGPNSTSYGSNAFHAVINIITRHAADVEGTQLTSQVGNNGVRYHHLRTSGGNDRNQWRLSATDKASDQLRDIYAPAEHCDPGCSDHRRVSFANLKLNRNISPTESMDADLLYMSSSSELPGYQASSNTISEQHGEVGARYFNDLTSDHRLQISGYASVYERRQLQLTNDLPVGYLDKDLATLFDINPEAAFELAEGQFPPPSTDFSDLQQLGLLMTLAMRYADPSDFLVPVSARIDSYNTSYRYDAELQDTYSPIDNLVLVNGLGYRYDRVSSEDYYGGVVDDHRYRAFSNATWKPVKKVSLHAGMMAEKEGDTATIYSHRAAMNYLYTPLQSMRIVYSKSARTADFFEKYVDWRYRFEDIQTAAETEYGEYLFASQQGPGKLPPQYIESFELGFHGSTRSSGHRTYWDLKVFREQIYDAIYKQTGLMYPTYTDNQILFEGVEWEFAYSPQRETTLRMNSAWSTISYDLEEGMNADVLLNVYAPFTQTLSWQQQWGNRLNSMVTFIAVVDAGTPGEGEPSSEVRRLDVNLFRDTTLFGIEGQWQVRVQHDFSADPYLADPQFRIDGEPFEHLTRIQAGLQLNF